ncbi:hypothetical protein CPB83DRAFT_495899 [Crepidotus variabilis]|uniref:Uncharacterized protein n=1 Tax=Crepidotus variabilis TaxID=179855 RepID=A0A9P6EC54_9AGAR|nr:hypothetical protein CPB83DRAFT_495899 [Crepidotus variabilis]
MKLLDWLTSGGAIRYTQSQNATQPSGLGSSGTTQGLSSTQLPPPTQATQSTQISSSLSASSAIPGNNLQPNLSARGVRTNSAGEYILIEPNDMGALCNGTIMKTDAKKLFRLHPRDLEGCPVTQRLVRDHSVQDPNAKIVRDIYYQRDIELIAWRKHGGFWGFVDRLCILEDRYVALPGKLKEKFPLPFAYKMEWSRLSTAARESDPSSESSSSEQEDPVERPSLRKLSV